MATNDAHPTTTHKTGNISGRAGGGTTNASAMCKMIIKSIDKGKNDL
jgi:hypothetical protein